MSSHHIVRDEQEPALLVAAPGMLSAEGIGSLLEWSPTVMVLSPMVDRVLAWGIKLDVVVCFEDEVETLRPVLQPQSPVKVLAIPRDSGQLLATALVFLHQSKHTAVNVLADLHHQGQDTFLALQEFTGVLQLVVYSQGHKCWPARANRLEKWLPKGQELELLPLQAGMRLRTQGLFPAFNNDFWEQPVQVKAEEEGRVTAEATGPFWIYEKVE